jgi:small subunit ribosomal protein S7
MSEILVFNKWPSTGIVVNDPGLERYITVAPIMVPKTGARYAGQKFYKSKISIVERLINRLMTPGHKSKKHYITSGVVTGKATTVYKIVFDAFILIEKRTKKNPVEVLVKAVENAAPREEIITIEYGGARYPKAVECAPQRRIDQVLKLFVQTTFQKTHNTKKSAAVALADEIVAAYQMSQNSTAISKKLELERQADASR